MRSKTTGRQRIHRWTALVAVLAVGATGWTASGSIVDALARGRADAVQIWLRPAGGPVVGDVIGLDVWASGIRDVAAFEVAAVVDPRAARIVHVESDLSKRPGSVDISVGDLDGRAVLAAFTPQPTAQPRGQQGRIGTLYVRPLRDGHIDVAIGAARAVTLDGTVLPVEITGSRADLAAKGSKRARDVADVVYPAPATPWLLPPAEAQRPIIRSLDEVQLDWLSTRISGDPCALAGSPGSCLDISDVQRTAAADSAASAGGARRGLMGGESVSAAFASTTFVVNSVGDAWDKNAGNGVCETSAGDCTLRAAMQEASELAGPNRIEFAIPGSGVHQINIGQRLPALRDNSGGTVIDGYTQPGASVNTAPWVSNATIKIEIVGNGLSAFDGIALTSQGNELRGLSIYNVRRPIWIYQTGSATPGNKIRGNFIGTNAAGTFQAPGLVNAAHGIHIEQNSPGTVIGGPNPADRNVVSGNGRHGIGIWHGGSDDSVIQGNVVGLSPDGTRRLANRKHGVDLNFGASDSFVGGFGAGEGNLISGNDDTGVELSHQTTTKNNLVAGNLIGTDAASAGPAYAANVNTGVYIEDAASDSVIEANVIGNNGKGGIRILSGGNNGVTTGIVVRNNWIGVSKTGSPIGNGQLGVAADAIANQIGPGNRIEFNDGAGIRSTDLDASNIFTANRIASNTGLPVDLAPIGSANPNDPGDGDTGPNGLLNTPVVTSATSTTVNGSACAGCTVEIFSAGTTTPAVPYGPALAHLGTVVANSGGAFVASLTLAEGQWLTTTATDAGGNTSEMSANVQVASSNTAPTVNAGPDIVLDERQTATLTATGFDADNDPLTYAWDLNSDGTYETPGRSVQYTAPDIGPAVVVIGVVARDGRGGEGFDQLQVTINDVPAPPAAPIAKFVVPSELRVGDAVTLSVQNVVADPGQVDARFDCGTGYNTWSTSTSRSCASASAGVTAVAVQLRGSNGLVRTYDADLAVLGITSTNSGFESGSGSQASGWIQEDTVRTNGQANAGVWSMVNAADGTSKASQTGLAPGAGWANFSARVKAPPQSGTVRLVMRLKWYNSGGGLIRQSSSPAVNSATSGWQLIEKTLVVPSSAASVTFEVAWTTTGGAKVYVDDARFGPAELLLNPAVDDGNGNGDPDDWWGRSRFVSEALTVYDAPWSGRINGDGTSFSVGQRIDGVNGGVPHALSLWVNVPPATTGTLRLRVRWFDSNDKKISTIEVDSFTGETSGWVQLNGTATAPGNAVRADFDMWAAQVDGPAFVDRGSLIQL